MGFGWGGKNNSGDKKKKTLPAVRRQKLEKKEETKEKNVTENLKSHSKKEKFRGVRGCLKNSRPKGKNSSQTRRKKRTHCRIENGKRLLAKCNGKKNQNREKKFGSGDL